jgi:hypothetical protein
MARRGRIIPAPITAEDPVAGRGGDHEGDDEEGVAREREDAGEEKGGGQAVRPALHDS